VAAWFGASVLFEDKMIALLSLLFGAGLVLMADHAREAGESFAKRWYLRCVWLYVFGVVHAIAIWYGDILNTYAIAGALLFFVRSWPARRLAWLGVGVLLIYPAITFLPLAWQHDAPGPIDALRARLAQAPPVPSGPARETVALGGSWLAAVRWHWEIFFRWHVEGAYLFNLWRCAGLMLFGMALARARFFEGGMPRIRRTMLGLGLGLGGACAIASVTILLLRDRWLSGVLGFDPQRLAWPLFLQRWLQYASGILLGLGYAALLVGWCERGSSPLRTRLAAAGRLALTNYLVQSLVCTFLFYGWGCGLFGRLSMLELLGVVAAIVFAQLVASPLWLARFVMGPFEWAWRSLTLMRSLPLRRSMGSLVPSE
jgi:uncharacterized protein